MKIENLKIGFAGLIIGSTVLFACTKAKNDDIFPKGDVPPVAGGYTAAGQVASANLIAYWGFNDGSVKDSVSGTTGTNAGMTFTDGIRGKALTGNPDATKRAYATAPANAAIKAMTQYTVSFWVNTSQNTGATGIFGLGDTQGFWGNINVFFENGGTTTLARFKTIYEDNGATFDNNIQEVPNGFNNWVQYVITYDGAGTFKSYVNGTLARSTTVAGMGPIRFTNIGPVVFGTLHFMTVPSSTSGTTAQDLAGYLPGKIDEVRVYNKALSVIEISALTILEGPGR
ncbi:LamG domain-containing protein [Pedobacter sp.]|jgi:hypothetical protein|uniref:LamG domain-containing protein n=1 Tax=Pedobacter sp. TaxID=1411316 RepID=UPI002BB6102C|nr:LamG domain-containing protein [Pedobacter sp.]HWW38260.1 LamG domain-containing protein [Pedobacter sp.]